MSHSGGKILLNRVIDRKNYILHLLVIKLVLNVR